jgi:hypothetical protein
VKKYAINYLQNLESLSEKYDFIYLIITFFYGNKNNSPTNKMSIWTLKSPENECKKKNTSR